MADSFRAAGAKSKVLQLLRNVPGVNGVGFGWTPQGERCVRVNVSTGFRERNLVPPDVDGVAVQVVEVGSIEMR